MVTALQLVVILSYTFSSFLLVPALSVKPQTVVTLSGDSPGGVFPKLRYMEECVCAGPRAEECVNVFVLGSGS